MTGCITIPCKKNMPSHLSVVQEASHSQKLAAPLVLIHDGGGTIVSYHYLRPLSRTVYAIQNPRLYSGQKWSSGMREMAEMYADFIRLALPSGNVLLGGKSWRLVEILKHHLTEQGWSFGGLLSLEIAHVLQRDPALCVTGIIMIDSPFPHARCCSSDLIVEHTKILSTKSRPELEMLVKVMLKTSVEMVSSWSIPFKSRGTDPVSTDGNKQETAQSMGRQDDRTEGKGAPSCTSCRKSLQICPCEGGQS